ncbi:MAG TPA: lamin tail domain-containing protein [Thermoguttaceae bacterium]|nr:lamin tail domain-containing protein [Thermoguttaceae bacterium]
MELINPDGSEGFQVDCGIRIQGGWFRQTGVKKHSFRLLFKGQYGPSKLNFPLFGEDAVDSFDTITLRAGANDGYAWDAARYTEQYIRDQFGRSLQGAAGQVASHGTFVHLYINGVYWGLYNPVERPDDAFSASYFGGDKDDWDSINSGAPTNGTNAAWNQMVSLSQAASSLLIPYMRLQGKNLDGTPNPSYPNLLDVTNYVDYLIVNVWGGNWDWPGKNWWAGRENTPDSTGFKFYCWDFENTMGNNLGRSPLNKNALNNNFTSVGAPHASLKNNAEYKMLFADRIHRLFFNGGILTPGSLIPRYTELAAQVERAIVAESARWGDMYRSPPLTLEDWYDRDANYSDGHAGRDWILNYYLPQRTDIVLNQFKSAGLYPNVAAPMFQVKRGTSVWYQHGGLLQPGDRLAFPTASGTIYYTTDGTDPRAIGGSISPIAMAYSGTPVTLADSAVVKSRTYSSGQWSALNEAQFYVHTPASAATLAIAEINYNPHDPTAAELNTQPAGDEDFVASSFEFVELLNRSAGTVIDLTNVEFTEGITFRFNDGAVRYLAPGERVVVVADTQAFAARYGGGINVAGTFTGKLDNNGETLCLVAADGQDIVNFRYNDNDPWPSRPDGRGATLELVYQSGTPAANYGNSEVWRPSSRYGGTPGKVPAADLGVVVNEVLTHTDCPQVDAIELHNTTQAAVEIGGWYLSDDWGWASNPDNGDYKNFRIPDGTAIPAGGYLVFYEGHYDHLGVLRFDDDEFGGLDASGFALNGAKGDEVWLMEADAGGNLTRFADHVEFREAANGESFGRWPNDVGRMVPMAQLTLGGENTGPRVGPVVITEIMYSPPVGGDEFVELFNPTFAAVPLFDPQHPENTWRIGGLDYDFPQDVEIPGGGLVLVVAIDPAAFRTKYSVPAEVQIFGPYQGALDNAGERLQLLRPDGPTDDDPTDDVPPVIPRLLVDEVDYEPTGLWPAEADGGGDSLHRGQSGSWGNDPTSWAAGVPTPGAVTFTLQPQVVARHVFYNASTFDGSNPGISAADDLAIATDKTALGPDGIATFANYTSYSRGVNGIMVDLFVPGAAITADDFRFHVGIDDDPNHWAEAPPPANFSVRAGAGADGSDRVTFVWDSGAIQNEWLQVTVLADDLDLAADDVFYFGNAVAESGNAPGNAQVTVVDLLLARNNPRSILEPATVDFAYDFNRDGRVNSTDVLLARNNQTNFLGALKLIDLSSGGVPQAASSPIPTPSGLDWLAAFDEISRQDRSLDQSDRAAEAVDRLLATYWY